MTITNRDPDRVARDIEIALTDPVKVHSPEEVAGFKAAALVYPKLKVALSSSTDGHLTLSESASGVHFDWPATTDGIAEFVIAVVAAFFPELHDYVYSAGIDEPDKARLLAEDHLMEALAADVVSMARAQGLVITQ